MEEVRSWVLLVEISLLEIPIPKTLAGSFRRSIVKLNTDPELPLHYKFINHKAIAQPKRKK